MTGWNWRSTLILSEYNFLKMAFECDSRKEAHKDELDAQHTSGQAQKSIRSLISTHFESKGPR